MPPPLIISALKDEIAGFKKLLTIDKTYQKDRVRFFEGRFEGHSLILGYSGIGFDATAEALAFLHALVPFEAVIGTGYVGALEDALSPGDLFCAHEICYEKHRDTKNLWPVSQNLLECLKAALEGQESFHEGRLLTVDKALVNEGQKRGAARDFQASAVDMESAAIAEFCKAQDIPFAIVRAILDGVASTVPDPGNFLDEAKEVSKQKALAFAAKNPSAVWKLPQLAKLAKEARQSLTRGLPLLIRAIT
jgi:adenosylhomocysteine nucleosidase